jgi:hypothetical protein
MAIGTRPIAVNINTGVLAYDQVDVATLGMLDVGDETYDRLAASSASQAPTSGQLRLTYFTARRTEVSTQVRVMTGATAASATPTLCRIGIWEVAADGSATLVAATSNDTTLFAAANGTYTRSWTTPFTKVAGRRYAIAPLVVTGGTAPSYQGITQNAAEAAQLPRTTGNVSGASDLPATFVDGSSAGSGIRIYLVVLP